MTFDVWNSFEVFGKFKPSQELTFGKCFHRRALALPLHPYARARPWLRRVAAPRRKEPSPLPLVLKTFSLMSVKFPKGVRPLRKVWHPSAKGGRPLRKVSRPLAKGWHPFRKVWHPLALVLQHQRKVFQHLAKGAGRFGENHDLFAKKPVFSGRRRPGSFSAVKLGQPKQTQKQKRQNTP
jgi:hypothetical protein